MLDQSSVATLLCKCLGKTSSFIANREKCMTADWFQKIWKYLNEFVDLELFEGLPLIPMKNNEVGTLQANSLLLLDTENEREDDLVTVMKQIGFVVVEGLPGYVQQNKSLFGKYLYTCNPEGITKLLMNISEKIGNRKLSKQISQIYSMAGKSLLREKICEFFLAKQPTKGLIELIKSLPIHENTNSQDLVSIDECQEICPNVQSDLVPCKTLLKYTDRSQKTFVEKLGGRLITEEELILKYLLPEIEAGESTADYIAKLNFVVTTATSGLFNNSALASEIRRKLKSIDFVTADSGERRKPRELFEPSEHLTKLFKGEVGRFPSEDFSIEPKLSLLRKLDLKTEKCVTAKDITDCIKMVAGSKDIGETEKRNKAQNIAIHLTDHIDLLNDRELKRILETESWIPIEKQRPKHYPSSLEWFADANNANPFSCLVKMHFGTASNLLGSVMPIISKDFETFQVIFSSLHRETISVAKVCQHLSCVIHDYKESERNEFIIVLKDVYTLLLQKAQQGHCSALQDAIKEYFPDAKWLWHGSGFASPKQIVLHDNLKDLDLKPFVYKLPIDMKPFEKLIEMFGGITEYSDDLFIQILSEIKEEHDSKRSPEEASRDLNICERLLSILAERKLSRENLNRIVVPVHSTDDRPFMLVGIDQAVYSSGIHYNDDEDTNNLENVFHLHDRIPEWVAQKLHIKSLTSQLIGAEDLGIFEEYGQSEPLTRRISNILKDYGDGLAIFKELIQNADDANAIQVKLLYDERQNENMRSQLIDPGMADLQGSALWAFNDAKFSKEDFDNIVKLSGATKEDKRDKIGKFGLGFNAVYNITDAPSFVSANKLVILDPHTTNLGKAIRDKSKPGVKIPLGPERKRLRRLQDQIRVYDGVFGMDASLESNYRYFDGTLFRFPLRTRKQAGASEIKNLCYDKNEMKVLIQKFACEASRLLMFTQNVSLVQFYHLSENAASPDEMALLVQIEKSVYRPDTGSLETFQVMSKSSAMVSRKLQGEQMEEFQMGHKVDIVCRISNKARDDFEVSAQDSKETWLLHTVIDASDCMDLASQYPQLNPVSTVAVCLDESRKSFKHQSVKGYFFCFLPLPMPNRLHVHINGTFALTKDRKCFQQGSEDDKELDSAESHWNRLLMSGPVPSAYVQLLIALSRSVKLDTEEDWYKLWPFVEASLLDKNLLKSFYSKAIEEDLEIWPKVSGQSLSWLNWSKIRTLGKNVIDTGIGPAIENVYKVFCPSQKILRIPEHIVAAIEDAGLKDALKNITLSFTEFFTVSFIPNIGDPRIQQVDRDKIICTALQYFNSGEVFEAFKSNCCVPTEPKGILKRPADLVKSESKAAALYRISENVFPAKLLQDYLTSHQLEKLGMISDGITIGLLVNRAKTVNDLGQADYKAAVNRVRTIFKLLDEMNLPSDENHPETLEWKNIPFLPVKRRPSSFGSLPWKGSTITTKFVAPQKACIGELENVVGCHEVIAEDGHIAHRNNDIRRYIGMIMEVSVSAVAEQVCLISQHKLNNSESKASLSEVFESIYQYLSRQLRSNNSIKQELQKEFHNKSAILTEQGDIVRSEKVAFNHQFSAEPYLFKLQPHYEEYYRQLMVAFGVKETFTLQNYENALIELKDHFGTRKISSKQVKLVRNLLESIRDENQASEPDAQQANIVLPDENGILRDKDAIFVIDSVWFKTDTRLKYLHKDIPPDLALSLGARTARSKSILSQSRGLPFGQHEKLTVRLKRILDAYPSNLQILYELLQNADDAGASTVEFVLDERCHPSDNIFGDKWRPLQGPALVIYNDAPFSENDIQGIQNLGEGSKSNDVLKTGQYGIGFNVVYQISDVPCLLAGLKDRGEDVLCIFDPHARFLDECSEAEPGRMFENARDYLRDNFKDIYATFLPEVLTEKKSAIFRLPLRTKEMAKSSYLKNEPTTIEGILNMFESFKREGSEALLFLKTVRSVELHRIDSHGKSSRITSVNAKLSFPSAQKLEKMNAECLTLVKSRYDRSNAKRDYESFEYRVDLQCDGKSEGKWKIIQKCASLNSQDLPKEIEEQYKNKELPLIPIGGIAREERASGKRKDPGKKEAGDKRNSNRKVYCLLPLTVTSSLPVHINGKFILDYESRRRLWYTNGDGYQTSWNYYIIDNCVLPSYVQLIRSDVSHLRKIFLPEQPSFEEDFETKIFSDKPFHPHEIYRYFHLFPKINSNKEAHEYDKELIVRFYKQLKEDEVDCLPALKYDNTLESPGLDFYPPCSESKKFYIPSFKKPLCFDEKAKSACCIALAKCGFNVYSVPEHIVKGFDESKVPLERLSPAIVAEYLKENADSVLSGKDEIPLEKSPFADLKTVKNLLRYCQMNEDLNKKVDENQMNEKLDLEGLPLLVTEDNMLRVFDSKKFVYYDYLSTLCPRRQRSTLNIELQNVLEKYKDNVEGPVRRLTLESLDQALKEDSEPWLREMEEIDITERNVHAMFPTKNWLRDIWNFLEREYGRLKKNLEQANNQTLNKPASKTDDSPRILLRGMLHWCIFPIRRQTVELKKPSKHYLTKISLACFAINPTGEVDDIIKKIGLAEPYPQPLLTQSEKETRLFLSNIRGVINLIREFAANENDPCAFIDALVRDKERSDSRFTCLSKDCAKNLLHYFQRRIGKTKRELKWRFSQLKGLPVWEDLGGKLKVLSKAYRWYFVSDEIPKAGISKLQDLSNILLLKEDGGLKSLYSFIDIKGSQADDVYCKEILPAFDSFTAGERMEHLTFLISKWTLDNEYHPSIFENLRLTGCFEKDGSLLPPSRFFDPEVEVFRIMLEDKDFPPESCRSAPWLKFLKMLDLISKVSSSHFCEFAEKVSNTSDKSDAKEKSESLIEYFRSSDDLKKDVGFHRRICAIPFMISDPIPKNLLEILTPENAQERIAFEGSIEYQYSVDNCKLAWTVKKILPSYTKTYYIDNELPLERLGVKKMSCSIVAENLANVSRSDLLTPKRKGVKCYDAKYKQHFRSVFDSSYEFLNNDIDKIDEQTCARLAAIPLVLTESNMISIASKVTLKPGWDHPPYICSMPIELGKYAGLFKKIGMSAEPTVEQLARVLEDLESCCHGKDLGPNEARIVQRCLPQIFLKLKKEDFPDSVTKLYLPGSFGQNCETIRLLESQNLVFFDDHHLEDRLRSFKKPRMQLNSKATEERQFVERLPESIKPKKLSQLIEERMLPSETLPNEGFAKELEERFNSGEVVSCILRLLQHQLTDDQEVTSQAEKFHELLANVSVVSKREIKTALYSLAGSIIEGSIKSRDIYIEISDDSLVINLAAVAGEPDVSELASAVIEFFSTLLTSASLAVFLVPILTKPIGELHEYLDKQGIINDGSYKSYIKAPYTKGDLVPFDLHCLLNNDIAIFEVGEYVAFEVEDPAMEDKNGDPIYMYAVIEEVLPGDFYKIDLGCGESKTAYKTELYKFLREVDFQDVDESPTKEEIIEAIAQELKSAFERGETYAKRVIKRLWLIWHPDKNPGREQLCTEIFQFIQQESGRLCRADVVTTFWRSSFNRYRTRGSMFARSRRQRADNFTRRGDWWVPRHDAENPQPYQAKRWYRQAKYDYQAAKRVVEDHCEWICFKCHQVSSINAFFLPDLWIVIYSEIYQYAFTITNFCRDLIPISNIKQVGFGRQGLPCRKMVGMCLPGTSLKHFIYGEVRPQLSETNLTDTKLSAKNCGSAKNLFVKNIIMII